MKTALIPTFSLIAAILVGCSDGSDVGSGNGSTDGGFRAVNGITDSSGLTVSLDGSATASVSFGAVGQNYLVAAGSYSATLSSDAETFQIPAVAIATDQLTTLFATGTIAGTHGGFTTQESLTAPASGLRLQWVHAAYAESQSVPEFDIYLVAPGSGITGATATAVSYGSSSGEVALAAGKYEIVITDPNNANAIVFDSGATGVTMPLAGSSTSTFSLNIAALDAAGGSKDGSPISLLLLQNTGESQALFNGQN